MIDVFWDTIGVETITFGSSFLVLIWCICSGHMTHEITSLTQPRSFYLVSRSEAAPSTVLLTPSDYVYVLVTNIRIVLCLS